MIISSKSAPLDFESNDLKSLCTIEIKSFDNQPMLNGIYPLIEIL